MVATRKKPSVPAPPTSRTNSTQALPRTVGAKSHAKTLDSLPSSSLSSSKNAPNGVLQSTHSPKSKPSTPLAGRGRGKRSLVDRIFFLFLATFATYALYTCPSDSHHDYSVCRSLATYRTHVLEPYVIPPVRAVLAHPYEQYAKPVYQNYIQPVTPYLAAAQRQTAPYVNNVVRLSKRVTSSVWDTVLMPYWTRAIVPRYTFYLEPLVNKYVSPLTKRVRYYNRLAKPYVRSFAHYTSVYAHRGEKYVLLAYDRSQPYVIRLYTFMKPHMLRGYAQIKPLLVKITQVAQSKGKYVASKVIALFQVALGRVGDLRRDFVDPHVLRIWEKAVEKSGPSVTKVGSTSTTPASLHMTPKADTYSEPMTVKATPQPTGLSTVESIPLSSTVADYVTKASQEPVIPDTSTPEVIVPTPEATLEKAVSVAEASAAHASNVIAGMESEIREAEPRLIVESTFDPVEPPAPTASETSIDQPLPDPPQATSPTELEDLDDFLREIGLDEEEKVPEPVLEPEPTTPPSKEEDIEAKKVATATKRANIVGRHVRWQSELDSLVKDLEIRVKEDIETVRRDAIARIGKLPSDQTRSVAHGKGKEATDKIQTDSEKLLKGLEAYVKKLSSHVVSQEDVEKEKEKWGKLIDKVEGRFKDLVRGIQEDVHGWYVQVKDKELSAALASAKEVKTLADRAQADLGLDYAWLDDVTYYDWQNYHDLMRVYERFDQTVRALQNGTHTDAPEDKLILVLNQLDREVQIIIAGFAIKMNALIREGNSWLDNALEVPPTNETDEEDEDEECEEGEEEVEEPAVSILPISPEPSADRVDPANVLIGKSAEQIQNMAQQAVVNQRTEL